MPRSPGPLGSIDRNDPSCPTPGASGAPKFDRLPTRIRFGSSTAPGWMNEGNRLGIGFAQAPGGGTFKNDPTCEMADAPGIFVAMTWASTSIIAWARTPRHRSPLTTAVPATKATMPTATRLLICLMKLPPVDLMCALGPHVLKSTDKN